MENKSFSPQKPEPPDLLHCCTKNCGTDLCPKHRLSIDSQKSYSFEESMGVLRKIKDDALMIEVQKPLLLKKVIKRMIQQAKTKEELERLLNTFTEISQFSDDNFNEARMLIADKIKSFNL